MSIRPFVPKDFTVPETLSTEEFRLRMLTVNDVVKDYDAVMSSVDHLRTIWPGGKWPEGLTLEQNLIDLGWHQKEFQIRRSFAYTVLNPSGTTVVGCVYIFPTKKPGYDAEVYLWARQSELAGGLEARLHAAVRDWIEKEWPFAAAAFPGRDIAWDAWRSIPDEEVGRDLSATLPHDLAIPILPSRSLEETVAFYVRLGFEGGIHAHGGYAILRRGSVELHFFAHPELDPATSSAMCYLRVSDVDAIYRAFSDAGLPPRGIPRIDALEAKPWGMREFAIVDPDGNLLRIGQVVASNR